MVKRLAAEMDEAEPPAHADDADERRWRAVGAHGRERRLLS